MIHRPHFTGYGVKPHVDQRPTLSKALIRANWYQGITETHFASCKRFLCFSEYRPPAASAQRAPDGRNAGEHEGFKGLQWFDDFEGDTLTLEMHPPKFYAPASNTSPFIPKLGKIGTNRTGSKCRSGAAFRLTETRRNCSAQSHADKGA